ncbi:hypothetical protein Syun_018500 [Stephania yunnanensis]|uniref:Secreted protein n=1 Tax=Stephania yunnanensis TaxID=152371 RepID=A0AAP0ISC6_9MAGN
MGMCLILCQLPLHMNMTSAQESLALMAVDNGVPSLGGNAHNDNLYKAECFARQSQVGSCVLCLDFESLFFFVNHGDFFVVKPRFQFKHAFFFSNANMTFQLA